MKYFKRNGFVALVSMLSLTAYAGDSLPLSVAVSETKEFIQVSGHGIDTSNVIQQERIIQGTVLEEGTNEPLIGVNVVVKGTTIGTTTDIDGKYSIKIPSDKAILVFSYIGQKTEEYSVKGLTPPEREDNPRICTVIPSAGLPPFVVICTPAIFPCNDFMALAEAFFFKSLAFAIATEPVKSAFFCVI